MNGTAMLLPAALALPIGMLLICFFPTREGECRRFWCWPPSLHWWQRC